MESNPRARPERRASLITLVALAACGTPHRLPPRQVAWDTVAWRSDLAAWQHERDTAVPGALGPLAQVALCRIAPVELPETVGGGPDAACVIPRLSAAPDIGRLEAIDDSLRFIAGVPDRGGAHGRAAPTLAVRDRPELPGAPAWHGAIRLTARWADGMITVWGIDTLAPARKEFRGLDRWPAGPAWRLAARFIPAEHDWRLVPTVRGFDLPRQVAGTLVVDTPEGERRLTALAKGRDATTMLVVIHDGTTGDGSYPSGRFVDVVFPDANGATVIDFNRARNPDCAFTLSSPCPLPPRENWFTSRLEVGEKRYVASPDAH